MANISSAYGTFKLTGSFNSSFLDSVALVLISQFEGEYYTSFDTINSFDALVNELATGEEISFLAAGRWSFHSNLSYFGQWSILEEDTYLELCEKYFVPSGLRDYSLYLSKRKNLMDYMLENNLAFTYSYLDEEAGCEILAEATEELDGNFNVTQIDYNNYDYNLKNYCMVYERGDTEKLNEIAVDIVNLYLNKKTGINRFNSVVDDLVDYIKSDPEWFRLSPFIDIESKLDLKSSKIKKWMKEKIK